jgi:hypothetical protein
MASNSNFPNYFTYLFDLSIRHHPDMLIELIKMLVVVILTNYHLDACPWNSTHVGKIMSDLIW